MPEKKRFFPIDVFPKEYRKLKQEIAELRKKNKMQKDCVEATSEIVCHICQMLFKSESRLATLIAREAHYENEHREVTTTTTTRKGEHREEATTTKGDSSQETQHRSLEDGHSRECDVGEDGEETQKDLSFEISMEENIPAGNIEDKSLSKLMTDSDELKKLVGI